MTKFAAGLTVAVGLVLALIGVVTWWGAPEEPSKESRTFSALDLGGISATGGLSLSETEPGTPFHFWITARNSSDAVVIDLALLRVSPAGYKVERICRQEAAGEKCAPNSFSTSDSTQMGAALAAWGPIASALQPGQSITLWGELVAERVHPAEVLTLAVQWTRGAAAAQPVAQPGGVVSFGTLPVGYISVQARWVGAWLRVYDFLKDFTLPIILGLLGYILQKRLQEQEQSRKQQAEDLESRRQQEERRVEEQRQREAAERARLTQTWTQMLPESHRLATKYYVHIQAAARFFLGAVGERDKALASNNDQARRGAEHKMFYALLLFICVCAP